MYYHINELLLLSRFFGQSSVDCFEARSDLYWMTALSPAARELWRAGPGTGDTGISFPFLRVDPCWKRPKCQDLEMTHTHLSETSVWLLTRFMSVASPRLRHFPFTNVNSTSSCRPPDFSSIWRFSSFTFSGTSMLSNLASKLTPWKKGMLYRGESRGLNTRCVVDVQTPPVMASRPCLFSIWVRIRPCRRDAANIQT